MKKTILIQFIAVASVFSVEAQVQITVDATKEIKEISPYIYGRNNNLSDDPKNPTSSATWQLYKDAGLKFFRESGGNNSTKYNWRKKLTSHPDWYNNVYAHDWDYAAQSLETNMPEAKGMWAFQLLGQAAKTSSANFNDWGYNQSQWWSGVSNNWCGNGDPATYLEAWPADSTTAILTHWFNNQGLSKEQFQYWNMDNEPECWNSTHDDAMPQSIPVEDYIQRYVNVAVKARTLFPEIKIAGPVFTNEWQWYNWQNGTISDPQNPSKKYSWVEYFIKRMAEEQLRTGLRLLDVLDFHFYPENRQDITLQLHRVFYDTTYDYPGANGCKVINGGWDNSITKEYIFKRSTDWLDKYMGKNHGVTMGMSEMGSLYSQDPNVIAVCYASLLGTFAENNVEIFTPWDWYVGQWEILHLFTHYAGTISVQSASSLNEKVSAYSSLNVNKDMLSVVLVNRDVTNSQTTNITLENITSLSERISYYQLSNLPATETFKSSSDNALKTGNSTINNRTVSLTLPKLSVTVVRIPIKSLLSDIREIAKPDIRLYPNPAKNQLTVTSELESPTTLNFTDMTGQIIKTVLLPEKTIDVSNLKKGIYIVRIQNRTTNYSQKLIIE
ncbi:MAG: T9SS type A sorting domain-containing protein [Dysgonamonadaceae bacterium]|nr:T9SS type A sorting domain-containing protein [Dysgonamonadaceae bacterium]